jgi:hypothetical protein
MALLQLNCKVLPGSLDLPVRINFRMVVGIFVKFHIEESFWNLSSHSMFVEIEQQRRALHIYLFAENLLEQKIFGKKLLNRK